MQPSEKRTLLGKSSCTTCFWICPWEGEKQPRSTWQSSDILSKLRDRERRQFWPQLNKQPSAATSSVQLLRCSRLGSTGQEWKSKPDKFGLRNKTKVWGVHLTFVWLKVFALERLPSDICMIGLLLILMMKEAIRIDVCLSERYYVASVRLVLHCASLLGRYHYTIHISRWGSRLSSWIIVFGVWIQFKL